MNFKRKQTTLRGLLTAIAVIAVALAGWSQWRQVSQNRRLTEENGRLRDEVEQLKFEKDVEYIGFLLKVPTEALYHDCMPRAELNRIRWEAFEKHGVQDDFVPVFDLQAHRPDSPYLTVFPYDREGNVEHWKHLQGSFWEGHAINHADDGASLLVAKLKRSEDFRRRLLANKELADEFLKPLLLRMVKATDARSKYHAIEALLLLGDRSKIVLDVLHQSLNRPEQPHSRLDHVARVKYYSLNPEDARRLVREYELELTGPTK